MATDRVHLIGSVPLPDAEQVFRRLGAELGAHLKRMPDGETAERSALDSISSATCWKPTRRWRSTPSRRPSSCISGTAS